MRAEIGDLGWHKWKGRREGWEFSFAKRQKQAKLDVTSVRVNIKIKDNNKIIG